MDDNTLYNGPVANILDAIGYSNQAWNLRQSTNDVYATWQDPQLGGRLFLRAYAQTHAHRRFLDSLFEAGPEAILAMASRSTREIREAAKTYALKDDSPRERGRVRIPRRRTSPKDL